MVPQEADQ
jgi:hypothetical protein